MGLLALVSCLACASYLRLRAITFLGETAICEIKKDIFKRLLLQPYEFFETHKTGDLLSRLNSDTLLLQMLISNSIPIACRNILMGVGSIVLLFITHFYLTLYVFLLAPLILFLVFSLTISLISLIDSSAVILPYNFKTKEDVCVSKSLR